MGPAIRVQGFRRVRGLLPGERLGGWGGLGVQRQHARELGIRRIGFLGIGVFGGGARRDR
ncbi:MAG TPA: hypothetical protein VJ486_00110 [Geothrix sp.]|nr:hypothetical protein [Geothrix sp.]